MKDISDQLRDIYMYSVCRRNVATYIWKAYNGKIEIISVVLKLLTGHHCQLPGVGQCMMLAVSVVSFIIFL